MFSIIVLAAIIVFIWYVLSAPRSRPPKPKNPPRGYHYVWAKDKCKWILVAHHYNPPKFMTADDDSPKPKDGCLVFVLVFIVIVVILCFTFWHVA